MKTKTQLAELQNTLAYLLSCGRNIKPFLFSFEFLKLKTEFEGAASLIPDFELLGGDEDVEKVLHALRTASAIIGKDKIQLGIQLLGRLKAFESSSQPMKHLLDQIAYPDVWLRPITSSLGASALDSGLNIDSGWGKVNIKKGRMLPSSGRISRSFRLPNGDVVFAHFQNSELIVIDTENRDIRYRTPSQGDNIRFSFFTVSPGHNIGVIGRSIFSQREKSEYENNLVLFDFELREEILKLFFDEPVAAAQIDPSEESIWCIAGNKLSQTEIWNRKTLKEVELQGISTNNIHYFKIKDGKVYLADTSVFEVRRVSDLSVEFQFPISSYTEHEGRKLLLTDARQVLESTFRSGEFFASNEKQLLKVDINGLGVETLSEKFIGDPYFFLPEENLLVLSTKDRFIIWDVDKNKIISENDSLMEIEDLLSDGESSFYILQRDGMLRKQSFLDLRSVSPGIKHQGGVGLLIQKPSSNLVYSAGSDGKVLENRISNGQEVQPLTGIKGTITDFKFLKRRNMAVLTSDAGFFAFLSMDNIEKDSYVMDLRLPAQAVHPLFAKDFFVIHAEESIQLWKVNGSEALASYFSERNRWRAPYLSAVVQNGEHILISHDDPVIILHHIGSGRELKRYALKEKRNGKIEKLDVTRDGRNAVLLWDGMLSFLDLSTGNEKFFAPEIGYIDDFILLPDGEHMLLKSGSFDLWNINSRNRVRTYRNSQKDFRALSHSGQFFLLSEDKTLELWNIEETAPLTGFVCDFEISAAIISDDLKNIVVGDTAGFLHFLSIENLKNIAPSPVTAFKILGNFNVGCPWCSTGEEIPMLGNREMFTVNNEEVGKRIDCPHCGQKLLVNSFFHDWDLPFQLQDSSVFGTLIPTEKQGFFGKIFGSGTRNRKVPKDGFAKGLRRNRKGIVDYFTIMIGKQQTFLLQEALRAKLMLHSGDVEGAKQAALKNKKYTSLPSLAFALNDFTSNTYIETDFEEAGLLLPFSESPYVYEKWARTCLKNKESFPQAVGALERGLGIEPEHLGCLTAYAEFLFSPYGGNYQKAEQFLKIAENTCPSSGYEWAKIAKLWEEAEAHQNAISCFEKAAMYSKGGMDKMKYFANISSIYSKKLKNREMADIYFKKSKAAMPSYLKA